MNLKKILAMAAILSILCCFTACNRTSDNVTESEREDNSTVSEVVSSENESESEDKGKDKGNFESSKSKNKDSVFVYEGVSIVLPEGFTVDNSTSAFTIAYPNNSSEKMDNINFTKTNEPVTVYSEENINKTMKTLFENYEGCRNYKKYKIDGCDAISCDHTVIYNHTESGVEVKQSQLIVFTDSTVIITFTTIQKDYNDAFRKAIDSVRVCDFSTNVDGSLV